jgi:hypothetical protein
LLEAVPVAAGISLLPESFTKLQNVKSGPETHSPCHVVFPIKTHCPSDRDFGCAGINRQEEEDESALHRRSSDPR